MKNSRLKFRPKTCSKKQKEAYIISTSNEYAEYVWSDGSKGKTLETNQKGVYFAYLSLGGLTFFRSKSIEIK